MAEARITFHPERRGTGTLRLTETHWGYIVREASGAIGGAALAEAALRFFGLVLVLAAYGQWLLPAGLFPSDAVAAKVALSAALAWIGAGLYFFANRGFAHEIQVDTAKREFRFARRNGRGLTRVVRRLPFGVVESVFVRRGEAGWAQFFLRVQGVAAPLHLANGAERDLNLLHSRLCRDLKSPAERVEARLKDAEPRKVAVRARLRRSA
ncbi:MAG: hypothetical protein QNJ13_06925 [Paracoccaceae bacterium]|nr:hypothetical protein [Paracoccaceae bacterium]